MAYVVEDTFTFADGTVLTSHVATETGGPWTRHTSGAAVNMESAGGTKIRRSSTSSPSLFHYVTSVPSSADYYVEGTLAVQASTVSSDRLGVIGRFSTSALTGYDVVHDRTNQTWFLRRWDIGVATNLATFAQTLSTSTSYRVGLWMRGPIIRMLIDGVIRASVEDWAHAAAGVCGIIASGTSANSDTTGYHLADFHVHENVARSIYYVDPALGSSGVSTDLMGSSTAPFANIARATQEAPAGSMILLRGGTYNNQSITNDQKGRKAGSVIVKPYPGEELAVDIGTIDVSPSTPDLVQGIKFQGFGWGQANPPQFTTTGTGVEVLCSYIDNAQANDQARRTVIADNTSRTAADGNTSNAPVYITTAGTPDTFVYDTRVVRNRIDDPTGQGIQCRYFDNCVLYGNRISGISYRNDGVHKEAIRTYSSGSGSRLWIVDSNTIWDLDSSEVTCAIGCFDGQVHDVRIINNLIYDNNAPLSYKWEGVRGLLMAFNTVAVNGAKMSFDAPSAGIAGATGVILIGNMFPSVTGSFQNGSTSQTIVAYTDYNYIGSILPGSEGISAVVAGTNGTSTDPTFVDSGTDDWRLASSSTAHLDKISATTVLGHALPGTDIRGAAYTRPQNSTSDMGCYERNTGAGDP